MKNDTYSFSNTLGFASPVSSAGSVLSGSDSPPGCQAVPLCFVFSILPSKQGSKKCKRINLKKQNAPIFCVFCRLYFTNTGILAKVLGAFSLKRYQIVFSFNAVFLHFWFKRGMFFVLLRALMHISCVSFRDNVCLTDLLMFVIISFQNSKHRLYAFFITLIVILCIFTECTHHLHEGINDHLNRFLMLLGNVFFSLYALHRQ